MLTAKIAEKMLCIYHTKLHFFYTMYACKQWVWFDECHSMWKICSGSTAILIWPTKILVCLVSTSAACNEFKMLHTTREVAKFVGNTLRRVSTYCVHLGTQWNCELVKVVHYIDNSSCLATCVKTKLFLSFKTSVQWTQCKKHSMMWHKKLNSLDLTWNLIWTAIIHNNKLTVRVLCFLFRFLKLLLSLFSPTLNAIAKMEREKTEHLRHAFSLQFAFLCSMK